ncbi:hypothetical protein RSJ21_10430 [Clostridium botulinum]|uniref:Uncharacterized protein n=3 Tax=Clostridium botulinum TaxID=1491 RepID=A5I342_CLOBH|nr:hypothetical protein [Clostridium botulinum]EPS48416.1 hypothetical protein CFSAN002369_16730 [Clostridium botulinum CFSAN002369]EPS48926.1 hypothetical protein CFSAN002367_18273 [Clostridium botulinum CFSAN002367]ABS34361.1 hypothetical protein CLB_1855 [Clostridium botulinum A str. ATCC 19397]ABS38072.1 hypothetical protein CLC_1862 [Clostridium botulinum A str. Hall]ACO87032.1 hypothetical protein CLM_2135 [Clostridium botulinum A2 str. Kyoto]
MYANLSKEICIEDTEDLRVKEKSTLSKEGYKDYEVFVFTVKNSPSILQNRLESQVGDVVLYCYKWDNNPEQIVRVYVKKNSSKNLNTKECWKLLREDMKELGIETKKLVMHKS